MIVITYINDDCKLGSHVLYIMLVTRFYRTASSKSTIGAKVFTCLYIHTYVYDIEDKKMFQFSTARNFKGLHYLFQSIIAVTVFGISSLISISYLQTLIDLYEPGCQFQLYSESWPLAIPHRTIVFH